MQADVEVEEFDFPLREETRQDPIPFVVPETVPLEVPAEPILVPLKKEQDA